MILLCCVCVWREALSSPAKQQKKFRVSMRTICRVVSRRQCALSVGASANWATSDRVARPRSHVCARERAKKWHPRCARMRNTRVFAVPDKAQAPHAVASHSFAHCLASVTLPPALTGDRSRETAADASRSRSHRFVFALSVSLEGTSTDLLLAAGASTHGAAASAAARSAAG